MLHLHFLNVGDGDAILLEEHRPEGVFRMLVDAGNRDVDPTPDSRRQSLREHLEERGIHRIDVLVVTHLHPDHFCGLETLPEDVTIGRVYAGFFPARSGQRLPEEPDAPKTVRGLIGCLNRWAALTERLKASGTELCPAYTTLTDLALTPELRCDLSCTDEISCDVQRRTWEAMLNGEFAPDGIKYWSSKFRNPSALRVSVRYAGRRVELTGDCFGKTWENMAQGCDILKVPHHGDPKALTAPLMDRLHPKWAVISCEAEYVPRKDRPSALTMGLLESRGTKYWFTDSYAPPGQKGNRWTSVDFTISEDGTVLTPDDRESGGR